MAFDHLPNLHCAGCKDHGPLAPEPQCFGVPNYSTRASTATATADGLADEFVELAARVLEHGALDVKAVDCAIQDELGFNYGRMESEHLPADYDRLHAKLVAAMLNSLPAILAALRQPATEAAPDGKPIDREAYNRLYHQFDLKCRSVNRLQAENARLMKLVDGAE